MRITVVLDDELVADAQEYIGITDLAVLLREALRSLIAREAARRLALLGGSDGEAAASRNRSAWPTV